MAEEKIPETPWAVYCKFHGKVFYTKEQYHAQMMRPDKTWACPKPGCKGLCLWDDDNHEKYMEDGGSKI
jgi:hypothetical protein